ncbi:MAG: SUMF1/EgtB/PvdO family nonheme iron enzyme [Bradymonadales bacterium]
MPSCTPECQNGGTCTALNTCTCLSGWTGNSCQTPLCSPECQNEGICSAPDTCTCLSGWTGNRCQTPVCSPECQNGGTCSAPNTCTCPSGWTGNRCQTAVCSPECQNGGTCTAPNTCICSSGWMGSSCQTPVCAQACQNGGTCSAPNTCTCPSGWEGDYCEITAKRVRIPRSGDTSIFTMGRPFDDAVGSESNETPTHQVTLSAYFIDLYLVTASDYKLCVDAGKCTEPANKEDCTYNVIGKEDHPINCVDWQQAEAYCTWAGGRLPTEAEWERAAGGGDTYTRYSWGNVCPSEWNMQCHGANWTSTTAKANCSTTYCHDKYPKTSPVGAFHSDQSYEGLYDVCGNVFQWTSDWSMRRYTHSPVTNPTGPSSGSKRIARGGSYSSAVAVGIPYRSEFDPNWKNPSFGIRCAQTAP